VLLSWSCSRTIEEEEPRELVDHRIEPCRQHCEPMMSPECGAHPTDLVYATVDECVEDCAAVDPENGWGWARQEDGTDACAAEWITAAACMDGLTCEEQREYFTRVSPIEWRCDEEYDAKVDCYTARREDGGG
jgi:hypothetical protein